MRVNSFSLYLISLETPAFCGARERECMSIRRNSRVVIKLPKKEKLGTLG